MVRHQRDKVAEHVLRLTLVTIVGQDEIPGTGRLLVGLNALDAQAPVSGTVLVTYGDVLCCAPRLCAN